MISLVLIVLFAFIKAIYYLQMSTFQAHYINICLTHLSLLLPQKYCQLYRQSRTQGKHLQILEYKQLFHGVSCGTLASVPCGRRVSRERKKRLG
ncbi:hypothetical protein DFH29DRAFT_100247 [Suillus ampliporus]|nr:hypothetical protein DFH29DRAFT_100247 [Suillus ampliporus]